jgi:hypothetical protein
LIFRGFFIFFVDINIQKFYYEKQVLYN